MSHARSLPLYENLIFFLNYFLEILTTTLPGIIIEYFLLIEHRCLCSGEMFKGTVMQIK